MPDSTRLPREVWIAALTLEGIAGRGPEEVISCALRNMTQFLPQQPDIYCLPETFPYWNMPGEKPSAAVMATDWTPPILDALFRFARKNSCYVIAPLHTMAAGKCYNAAVVIDRTGKRLGEYRKSRTTVEEMDDGVSPGDADPPVFMTDFGTIGVQICFDIEWMDGWKKLKAKGAEIVFWPSAFSGGTRLNAMAWLHRYCIVSSTAKGPTKICEMTGETVAESGRFDPFGACASINLEKAFIHTWPYVTTFPQVHAKYGRKVKIRSLHEEEFSVIESLTPDVRVSDVLREFGIKDYEQHLQIAETKQRQRY